MNQQNTPPGGSCDTSKWEATPFPYPIDLSIALKSSTFRTFLPMEGLDAQGRTLLEGRSIQYPPLQSDYQECPFSGSRFKHQKLMNRGALRHFMKHRDRTISYFGDLSLLAADRLRSAPQPTESLYHMLHIAYTVYKAPQLWQLSTLYGQISASPPEIAIAAKLSHGLYDFTLSLLNHQSPLPSEITPEFLYILAEKQKRLIGRNEVCAGPPAFVRKFLSLTLCKNKKQKSIKHVDRFSLDDLLDYASLSWSAEKVSLIYNYLRLLVIKERVGNLEIGKHLRVSFPHALPIFQIAKGGKRPNDTDLRAHFSTHWWTQRTEQTVKSIQPFFESYTSVSQIDQYTNSGSRADWYKFELETIRAIEAISRGIDSLDLLPRSNNNADLGQIELFFGPQPYQFDPVI